mmetsp:Transcript_16754/g.39998  ORF Transcript_16754/g.39998 Transcript_16754/m.39998 type:complete len:94 (+) Transcript_16754:130-411(+)
MQHAESFHHKQYTRSRVQPSTTVSITIEKHPSPALSHPRNISNPTATCIHRIAPIGNTTDLQEALVKWRHSNIPAGMCDDAKSNVSPTPRHHA